MPRCRPLSPRLRPGSLNARIFHHLRVLATSERGSPTLWARRIGVRLGRTITRMQVWRLLRRMNLTHKKASLVPGALRLTLWPDQRVDGFHVGRLCRAARAPALSGASSSPVVAPLTGLITHVFRSQCARARLSQPASMRRFVLLWRCSCVAVNRSCLLTKKNSSYRSFSSAKARMDMRRAASGSRMGMSLQWYLHGLSVHVDHCCAVPSIQVAKCSGDNAACASIKHGMCRCLGLAPGQSPATRRRGSRRCWHDFLLPRQWQPHH